MAVISLLALRIFVFTHYYDYLFIEVYNNTSHFVHEGALVQSVPSTNGRLPVCGLIGVMLSEAVGCLHEGLHLLVTVL